MEVKKMKWQINEMTKEEIAEMGRVRQTDWWLIAKDLQELMKNEKSIKVAIEMPTSIDNSRQYTVAQTIRNWLKRLNVDLTNWRISGKRIDNQKIEVRVVSKK